MIKEFVKAESIKHAVSLHRKGYIFLAGGTEVNCHPQRQKKKKPDRVVSLQGLKLNQIKKQGKSISIGAMATMQEITDNPLVPEALRQAAGFIPTRSIRNMATLGGNIGAYRGDSYAIPTLLALNAEMECADGKPMSVADYLEKDDSELILRFIIPPVKGVCIAVKEAKSSSALPVVSAAVHVVVKKNTLSEVHIYAGCLGPKVLRLERAEQAALNDCSAVNVEKAVRASIKPKTDIMGNTEYKKYINAVKIAETVALATFRAGEV